MCLAIPAQVVGIEDRDRCLAVVAHPQQLGEGGRQIANLLWLVDEAAPIEGWIGAWVTVHAGFAMEKIDAATAQALSAMLSRLP